MESILEKITLYDILGYFFPGGFFLLLILFGGMQSEALELMESWNDYKAFLYLAFIFASFLIGILFSESSEQVRLVWNKLVERRRGNGNRFGEISMDEFFQNQLAETLIHSGVRESTDTIKANLQSGRHTYYKSHIYGVIQGRQDCKRIHYYASAYVMYKNMAVAILASSLVLFFKFHMNSRLFVVGIFVCAMLVLRSVRFMKKKNRYTLIWFLEKYR